MLLGGVESIAEEAGHTRKGMGQTGLARYVIRLKYLFIRYSRDILLGKPVSEKEEKIRGSLKHMWMDGASKGNKLPPVQGLPTEPLAKLVTKKAIDNVFSLVHL